MLVGIGLIGVVTATVASYFVGKETDENIAEVTKRLERMEVMMAELLARTNGNDDLPATAQLTVGPSAAPDGDNVAIPTPRTPTGSRSPRQPRVPAV